MSEQGRRWWSLRLSPMMIVCPLVMLFFCLCSSSVEAETDGKVWTWGRNNNGQLGNGMDTDSNVPEWTAIIGVAAVSAGEFHTVTLKTNGAVFAWGDNSLGQIGNGENTDTNVPVKTFMKEIISIAAGKAHTVALKREWMPWPSNRVWTWGWNNAGQLGNGTNTSSNLPVEVNLSSVSAIAAGWIHTVALKADGTVWAWGSNMYGQLGNGTNNDSNVPVQASMSGATAIAAGESHTVALKGDGTVWAWGSNMWGQLGNGENAYGNTVPVQALIGSVAAIAAGGSHTVALKTDGTVWTWGYNYYGQLGNGSNTDSNMPLQVNISDVIAVAAGQYHSIALKADGTVWTWGRNRHGQLGNGNNTDSSTPLQVNISDIIAVAAGGSHTIALRYAPRLPQINLPQTGQMECYDSSGTICACGGFGCPPGQDGEIRAGYPWPAPRFTSSGDCVIDKLTGLMWAQSSDGIVRTWQGTLDYANNFELCNYSDWRFPNLNELESLVNAGQSNPVQWLHDQGFSNVLEYPYWSSTTYAQITDGAWFVDFGNWSNFGKGSVVSHYKANDFCFLPVRGATTMPVKLWQTGQTVSYAQGDDGSIQAGETWPFRRYNDNNDGTIRDNLTVLMWLKDANCISTNYPVFDNDGTLGDGRVSWQHGLEFIAGINSGIHGNCGAGFNDWRMPNRKELFSLLDVSRSNPALPEGYLFFNLMSTGYWSSTTLGSNPENAWFIDMMGGGVGAMQKTLRNYVLPVRAGHMEVFSDVPAGFWAYDYIYAIYGTGIADGYADGTYRPSTYLTRGQMAAFIIRAKYGDGFTYSLTPHFSDVPSGHWAFKYVQKMYEDGISTGYPDGTYRPGEPVTRGQMAAFIVRGRYRENFTYSLTPHFTDVPSSHGSFKYIQKAYEEGIVSGYSDGTYRPSQYVNRAQMAAFILRAFFGMP